MSQVQPSADQEFLERLRREGEPMLQVLYDQYASVLYTRAYSILRKSEDAEEVVQDVFIKFWNCRHTVVIHTSLRAYLFQMCRNLVFDHIKAKARTVSVVQFDDTLSNAGGGLCTEAEVIFNDYHKHYLEAIETLPPGRRKVYHLCHVEGKTYDQVAAQLSISRNAVKDHIVHATRFIKKYVELSEGIVTVGILLVHYFV